MDFDDADLEAAGLTESERAALTADETDEDALAELANESGDDEPGNAAAAAAAPAAAPAAVPEDEEDDETPATVYRAEAPADADTKLADLQAKEDDAFAKLMDGDLTAQEYKAEQAKLQTERDEIREAQLKASISEEMRVQAVEDGWNRACQRFISQTKASEGIDYAGNKLLGRAFDAAVRELAADPANSQKPASFFLAGAHKQVKDAFGHKPAAAPAPAPAPKPADSRKPDLSNLPPSLANLPPAQDAVVGEDEFAFMRNLKGNDLERAIAGLNPAQLDRFMAD